MSGSASFQSERVLSIATWSNPDSGNLERAWERLGRKPCFTFGHVALILHNAYLDPSDNESRTSDILGLGPNQG